RLISCWADANAASFAVELGARFPQARIQAKGLIATEAFVSLPVDGEAGASLAIRSHFFEFLPLLDAGVDTDSPQLAHQLETGARYEVVVTTGGGLYRYRLFDAVEVVGRRRQTPLLRFLGKTNLISDHFGEKLDERQVRQAVAGLLTGRASAPRLRCWPANG
ncbi:MAG: GH3 auxin-responsive promoter family protein, partial [Caldilineaceae bacterium]|nr:GH3 auxin-responsive promoter family protein [Caldilineaceae bacterium]